MIWLSVDERMNDRRLATKRRNRTLVGSEDESLRDQSRCPGAVVIAEALTIKWSEKNPTWNTG
jgi:hypothetical protein